MSSTGSKKKLKILEVTFKKIPNNDDGLVHLEVQIREVDFREICNNCKNCDGCCKPKPKKE